MILITNDDGIHAEGLWKLFHALTPLDEVRVVAPDRERSAISMAITLHRAIQVKSHDRVHYAVDGTPVDCVHVALGALLKERPRLLVSGINHGANLGQDVHYSGTLAAAIQGTFFGVPSFAVSLVNGGEWYFDTAAHIAHRVAKCVLEHGLPPGIVLNVNVPDCPLSEIQSLTITRQDLGVYDARADEDPTSPGAYWIGGERQPPEDPSHTDLEAIRHRCVSITPIQLDLTAHDWLPRFRDWF